jgi:hypothetical protein
MLQWCGVPKAVDLCIRSHEWYGVPTRINIDSQRRQDYNLTIDRDTLALSGFSRKSSGGEYDI